MIFDEFHYLFRCRMEDLLQSIIKECNSKQLQNLKQAAQIAYGKKIMAQNLIIFS